MLQASTLQFFRDLSLNNHRDWFHQNKKRYDEVRLDYHRLIERLLQSMVLWDPSLGDLAPKDCTFRINRDIRFSKDKRPYKTHLGISIQPQGKKSGLAGYYLHLEEGASFLAGGIYMPPPELLKKIRKEIAYFYDDFKAMLQEEEFSKNFGDLDKPEALLLKRAPKGFEEEVMALPYLRLKSFTASQSLEDKDLTRVDFEKSIAHRFKILQPLVSFLNQGMLADENGAL
jgi:uncharacterized protein (TIGR02453 family)